MASSAAVFKDTNSSLPISGALPIKSLSHQSHNHNSRNHHVAHIGNQYSIHRTRRKSVSQTVAAAAIKEVGAMLNDQTVDDYPSPPSSLPNAVSTSLSLTNIIPNNLKNESVDATIAGNDLKCTECGKSYKHSSCLSKHLWEHTPEWTYTSKLLISKHQQVQLLEAASILVSMKPDTPRSGTDDPSSAAMITDSSNDSSSDTTPPPPVAIPSSATFSSRSRSSSHSFVHGSKRQSTSARMAGAPYSKSFQSSAGHSKDGLSSSSPPPMTKTYISPPTSASRLDSYKLRNNKQDDDEQLAAAVEMLSCGPNGANKNGASEILTSEHSQTSSPQEDIIDDIAMDLNENDNDGNSDHQTPCKIEAKSPKERLDDDDGVFGRMDE